MLTLSAFLAQLPPLHLSSARHIATSTTGAKAAGRVAVVGLLLGACNGGDGLLLPSEGQPSAIEVVGGDGQSGRVAEPLADPLVVAVSDTRNRPVEGATVTFELTSGGPGADIVPHTATTDANGEANAQIVLGTAIGRLTGKATVAMDAGILAPSASFTATAVSENANSMAAVAGEDQTGHVGAPLEEPLVVQVTDAFGNPIAGVPISWEAQGGGTVSETTVNTDDQGEASVERVLGPAAGSQTTVASSEGLAGSPVTFVHTALAGNASHLAIVSGDSQTGQIGSQLPAELVVRLIDGAGNGVPGTAVAWVVATGGGSVTPVNSTTDGDGRASARWTLGGTPGGNRLDAVVSGVGVASFEATATAGAPAALFIRTQPSSTARSGMPLERQPVVQLQDAAGNDVALGGVRVAAAIGQGGGDLSGTRERVTDGAGRATFSDLAITGPPGRHTLVFSSTGYASATSSDIDLRAISTSTAIVSDAPDPSAPGAVFTVEFRVTSAGPLPGGSVTVSDGAESCSGNLRDGAGSCSIALSNSGLRTLTATYSGAPGLEGSSDTESHRVEATPPPPPPNQPPVADYDSQCDGLTCRFTDKSSDPDGNIAARGWSFGDGSAGSSEKDPVHAFPTSGSYVVTLTVTDNGGATDDVSATVTVVAPPSNQPPTAAFTTDCKQLSCKFNSGESSDPDGRIESWAWTFGDGTTSDERSARHDYASGGTYTVTLTVTDDDGGTDAVSHDITVNAPAPPNKPPHAEFASSCADLVCSFNSDGSSDEDGTIVSRGWDFGDGTSSNEVDPSHAYSADGTYDVTLTVTDDAGATSSATHQVTVTSPPPPNQPPIADFTSSCADLTCSFNSEASSDADGSIASRSWDFGDATSSGEPDASHTYVAGGSYNVTLTVTDDDGATNSVTQQVTVTEPPPPDQTSAALTQK